MSRGVVYFLGIFLFVILGIPATLVAFTSNSMIQSVTTQSLVNHHDEETYADPTVAVYLAKEKKTVRIPLETYVGGVVAAEMPVTFHMEALKAQALSARTYIMDRLLKKDFSDMSHWGVAAKGAVVTNCIDHQVYLGRNELKEKWGPLFSQKMQRIEEAVYSTRGQMITYQGKPIYAAFFSTSNGRTENSEDYFSAKYPYLRSVTSYWDQKSPEYKKIKIFRISDMIHQVEKGVGKKIDIHSIAQGQPLIRIIRRTAGNRIAQVKIGNQTFSGKDIRTALRLASTDFSIHTTKKQIKFTSHGYGHGVGMSQWGANMMAGSGKSAHDIITHYYKGVQIESSVNK